MANKDKKITYIIKGDYVHNKIVVNGGTVNCYNMDVPKQDKEENEGQDRSEVHEHQDASDDVQAETDTVIDAEEVVEVSPVNVVPEHDYSEIQSVFQQEKVKKILDKLVVYGYLHADYKPTTLTTRGMAAYIAQTIGNMLGLNNFYQMFGDYWGYGNTVLSTALYKTLGTKKIDSLLKDISSIKKEIE